MHVYPLRWRMATDFSSVYFCHSFTEIPFRNYIDRTNLGSDFSYEKTVQVKAIREIDKQRNILNLFIQRKWNLDSPFYCLPNAKWRNYPPKSCKNKNSQRTEKTIDKWSRDPIVAVFSTHILEFAL